MIAIVLAMTKKGKVVGKDGKLPWEIPDELEHFRAITRNNVVVMGRKTHDSIGRILPHRVNIVVSRNMAPKEGVVVCGSVEEAVAEGKNYPGKDILIIGGAEVVKHSFDVADTMLLSYIKKEYDGDTHFPAFDESKWKVVKREDHPEWEFVVYKKKG